MSNVGFFELWGYPSLLERCGEDACEESVDNVDNEKCVDNVCECR